MNAGPVIVRELRAESRNPVNYWIRVIAAVLLLVPVVFIGLAGGLVAGSHGKEAFVVLTTILFVAAWIIIPVTISDCISRERREGTLGLLFLTPLNADLCSEPQHWPWSSAFVAQAYPPAGFGTVPVPVCNGEVNTGRDAQ